MYRHLLDIVIFEGDLHPGHFTPEKEPPVSFGKEAGWRPEQVWTT
jgi:hypothetical protein